MSYLSDALTANDPVRAAQQFNQRTMTESQQYGQALQQKNINEYNAALQSHSLNPFNALMGGIVGFFTGGPLGAVIGTAGGATSGGSNFSPISSALGGYAGGGVGKSLGGDATDLMGQVGNSFKPETLPKTSLLAASLATGKQDGLSTGIQAINAYDKAAQELKMKSDELALKKNEYLANNIVPTPYVDMAAKGADTVYRQGYFNKTTNQFIKSPDDPVVKLDPKSKSTEMYSAWNTITDSYTTAQKIPPDIKKAYDAKFSGSVGFLPLPQVGTKAVPMTNVIVNAQNERDVSHGLVKLSSQIQSSKEYNTYVSQYDNADKMLKQLSLKNPVADEVSKFALAGSVQSANTISDKDMAALGGSRDTKNQINRAIEHIKSGRMTEKDRALFIQLAHMNQQLAARNINSMMKKLGDSFQGAYPNVTKDRINQTIAPFMKTMVFNPETGKME